MSENGAAGMKVVLVRHGRPEAQKPDPQLTEPGAERVRERARWLEKVGVQVEQIRHSPFRRTTQTAEIMAKQLKPKAGIVEASVLDAEDAYPIIETLESEWDSVMYVGHEPCLIELMKRLLNRKDDDMEGGFGHCNIACLSRTDGKWMIEWTDPPSLRNYWRD